MLIRRLIAEYFDAGPEIRDLDYRVVPVERLRAEYGALRRHLLANFGPGERIALRLARGHRYLLALLACMETGVVFVPLRVEWPDARVEQIRGIVGFRLLLDDGEVEAIMGREASSPSSERALAPTAPDQPLYCLFTSGTTGVPKGVVIRRGSYENFLRWCLEFFREIGPADRLLNSTDYTFDVALAEVAIALTRRSAFFCSRFRDDLFTLLHELHELKITVVATVPNNLVMLLDERWMERADLSALRHALVAGARFPLKLARQFRRFLPATKVYNCYGPTEATIYCLARLLGDDERDFVEEQTVSVGTPLPGCVARIVDEQLREVSPGQRGELLVGGVQVMDSYLDDPGATRAALVEIDGVRYYRTGDLVFRNAAGDYFVTGRNDDTVKVSGQRVNLSDIDGYVQKLDFVRSCATIAVEDELRGASLILYVVASRPTPREAAFEALRQVLPKHQTPQDIRFVESLPINNSGKVSKKALRELYEKGPGAR
jgi:D-alanine--poly(phosphoribitol) ligase subunit 1